MKNFIYYNDLLLTYFFFKYIDIIKTNTNIIPDIKKYKALFSCDIIPADAIVNKEIPGSINKKVYAVYNIKLIFVIP